jgi:tetratricopeptide (TPR) repeat protein
MGINVVRILPFLLLFLISFNSKAGLFIGKLKSLQKDTILEIITLKGSLPPISQRVDVYTTFETTGLAPEQNIGRGHILSANKNVLRIKVVIVYGTWMAPFPEPNQALLPEHILKLKWPGTGTPIITETSEIERVEEMINFHQFEKAAKLSDSLISSNPSCGACVAAKGKLLYRLENFSGAEEQFTSALKLKPGISEYFSYRALVRIKLAKEREAQLDLDSAIFYFPKTERKENLIGLLKLNIHLLVAQNRKDKVCENSQRLKQLAPESFAFRNFDHFYCSPVSIKKAKYHVKGKLTFYSTSRLELKIGEAGKKYRKTKFSTNLKEGQILVMEAFLFEKNASSPVVKIYSIKENRIVFEILYWTGTEEFEPRPNPLNVDGEYYFFWE